jgi:hypothetical protein
MSSDIKEVKRFINISYPKRAAPMFMFKDFLTRGELNIDSIPLSLFDVPSIVTGLIDKDSSVKAQDFLRRFAKNKRNFYSFSPTVGVYYPTILELQVQGNVRDPQAWSLTGREFIPSTVKPKREFNCNDDILSLNNRDEFLHYVSNNLLDSSGLTKGREVKFYLPVQSGCVDDDILIRIRIAAVLGTNTNTGEKLTLENFTCY